jgi:hypothetical protein
MIPNTGLISEIPLLKFYDLNNKKYQLESLNLLNKNINKKFKRKDNPVKINNKENDESTKKRNLPESDCVKQIKIKNSSQSLRYQDMSVKIGKIVAKKQKSSVTSIKPEEINKNEKSYLRAAKSVGSITINKYKYGDQNIKEMLKRSKVINIKNLENFISETEKLIKTAKNENINNPEIKEKLKEDIEKSVLMAKKLSNNLQLCTKKGISKMESYLESFLEMVDNQHMERISRLEPRDVSKIVYDQHQTMNRSFLDDLKSFDFLLDIKKL